MRLTLTPSTVWWLLFLLLILNIGVYGQVIIGKVQDAKTLEPLPFANVFINNTTIGTVTDLKGNFSLRAIKHPGTYELVVSFVGYESFKSDITVAEDETISAEVKLIPSELELNNIEIKGSRDLIWERNLKRFEKIFLGKDKMAESCRILNPWVIDFADDPILKKFTAKAGDPIEIYNIALGYKVTFYLNAFWSDKTSYFISGNVRFEEMQSFDERERTAWEMNRRNSYLHSNHHLFKAMVENRIRGEGFKLYTEKQDFENVTVRSPNFNSDLGRLVIPYDTNRMVFTAGQTGLYTIRLKGRVEAHYLKERTTDRIYRDIQHQVSWIRLTKDSVIVNRDGFELNPTDVVVSGDMSADRVARMLPQDYQPDKMTVQKEEPVNETTLSLFQEKVYVHTDKPYYYPGEPLWLKGYVNYRSPGLRDSMSRTAYVEIVHPKKKILLSKVMEIDSGFFHGDFILPDTLSAGTYYLRAYTNFSRNFGDDNLFVQPVPILNIRDKVKPNSSLGAVTQDTLLTIVSDKRSYKTKEKISLTIRIKDEDNQPLASNLSIAVTDATQVVPLEISTPILSGFPVGEIKKELARKDFKYAIEYGVTFLGQFVNAKNKPEEATLNVVQILPRNFTMTRSDPNGLFTVSGVTFYDTARFSIQSINKKGEPYGKSKLLKSEVPPLNFKQNLFQLDILKTESPQRILSEYEVSSDSRMLEAIEVRAMRIVGEDPDYRVKRPYGRPDYVLTAKDLLSGYGNLLYTLPGKVPGLVVRQMNIKDETMQWVVYLQRGISMMFPAEVLVTVNNSIVGGRPADILSAINPENVESIEIKTGVNVLYGFYGGNGILAIYTKDGANIAKDTEHLPTISVPGYARPRKFKFPDYSDATKEHPADYRSLLYWNPEVITNERTGVATVSFYASDLPGNYRIVAEGVDQRGRPVRCVNFVEVD